jgi:hypothetical protein
VEAEGARWRRGDPERLDCGGAGSVEEGFEAGDGGGRRADARGPGREVERQFPAVEQFVAQGEAA